MLAEQQLEADGGLISIQREISTGERNLCRVCGVIVPLAFLRRLTALLVDVHGQHAHQSLLEAKNHMAFLDSFGDADFEAQKRRVEERYRLWRESSVRFAALRKENEQRAQRQEYLETRVRELDAAQLRPGETESLTAERARFASAERIDGAVRAAYGAVMGGGRSASAMDQLRDAMEALRRIEELDPRYQALANRLSSAFYEAEEIGIELRDVLESENFDPERNEAVQERLDLIRRLERRYGMPADDLAAQHEEMKDELARLEGMDERLRRAEVDYKDKLKAYRAEAALLTQARQALAARFESLMEAQLRDLGMQNTRFACVFESPEPGRKRVPTASGDDHVSFYIAPNPGEPLNPLDKTASGGELSRLMLAMKAAGAEHDGIPCMIFDEIDTGISGHVAEAVAEKMASIGRYHQVLCVTHLAQIAAMADAQYLVQKEVLQGRTRTTVRRLDEDGRVEEVARLIGVTESQQESGMAHARALLRAARKWKKGV